MIILTQSALGPGDSPTPWDENDDRDEAECRKHDREDREIDRLHYGWE